MMCIEFEGAQPIAKPKDMTDEQCSGAWTMPFTQEIDVVQEDGTTVKAHAQCWLMMYQPSKEDQEAIAAGGPVCLKIMAGGLPPHSVFTLNPVTGEPNV